MTRLRRELHLKIANAKFPFGIRARVENILVQAVCHFRLFRRRQQLNTSPLPGRTHFRVMPLKRGPKSNKDIRMYLLSQIHYVWVFGFNEYPNINNKNYPDTPFVIFAESIMLREGVARIRTNLEEFRTYRKKQMQDSGFQVIRGRVK